MNLRLTTLIAVLLIFSCVGCGHRKSESLESTEQVVDSIAIVAYQEFQEEELIANPSHRQRMVLWGVTLSGTPEEILQGLCTNSFFSVDTNRTKVVLIDGIPFGMNLCYEEGSNDVKSIVFITSRTSDGICLKVRKRLIDYFGEPDISDNDENGYTWFPDGHFLKFRHLHSDEGGWTFHMSR